MREIRLSAVLESENQSGTRVCCNLAKDEAMICKKSMYIPCDFQNRLDSGDNPSISMHTFAFGRTLLDTAVTSHTSLRPQLRAPRTHDETICNTRLRGS